MKTDVHVYLTSEQKGPLLAELRVHQEGNEDEAQSQKRLGKAFRAAPLVRVVLSPTNRFLLIGQWRISVVGTKIQIEVHELRIRSEKLDWELLEGEFPEPVVSSLASGPFSERHGLSKATDQMLATVIAKAASEASRNEVSQLRAIRYANEGSLSAHFKNPKSTVGLEALARLIGFRTALGEGRDQARAAVRSSLWVYLDDERAFHRYRRALDATLITKYAPAQARTRPWMRTHDAGVRQCRALEQELGEEVTALGGLLDAAATVSVAHEARAQDNFNRWAAIAALGLGLPSLVLAYLGASQFLPLRPLGPTALPLLPVIGAVLLALVFTWRHLPDTAGAKWSAVGLVLAIAVLIVSTGLLAGAVGSASPSDHQQTNRAAHR